MSPTCTYLFRARVPSASPVQSKKLRSRGGFKMDGGICGLTKEHKRRVKAFGALDLVLPASNRPRKEQVLPRVLNLQLRRSINRVKKDSINYSICTCSPGDEHLYMAMQFPS